MVKRRGSITTIFVGLLVVFVSALVMNIQHQQKDTAVEKSKPALVLSEQTGSAYQALTKLDVKGRAPKTGYAREQFGAGWADIDACDMRNYILRRDFSDVQLDSQDNCTVLAGTLNDPYTGRTLTFKRGNGTSSAVQIDHVVALSDAWQKGAQSLDESTRAEFANDPLNLLAVDGPTNNKKSDSDAATWLPPNKDYRCQYVARQVAIKQKYNLWVTSAERDAIVRVLSSCPEQLLPTSL